MHVSEISRVKPIIFVLTVFKLLLENRRLGRLVLNTGCLGIEYRCNVICKEERLS